MPSLSELAEALRAGKTTCLNLVNACLERIEDPAGEGRLAFLSVDAEGARKAAVAADLQRDAGIDLSPLMGIPVSVKDLFDVAGQTTRAGSVVLKDASPATHDADVVARLRQAGAIVIGRTNMTEFAYSGVGLNPHYGTPASPYDRQTQRIPGGSSSGAAVSVADGMAAFALGTDTGGSTRIPAALCGITGFKPTMRRISTRGVVPLSASFDSIGPLASTVGCCITVDQVLSGQAPHRLEPLPLRNLRLLVPKSTLDDLDDPTAEAFTRALAALSRTDAQIEERRIDVLDNPTRPANGARLLAAEAYAWHRNQLEKHADRYDPRVATRMAPASNVSAAEYIELLAWRRAFVAASTRALEGYDALLLPTTPHIAPPISALEASDDVYFETNKLMLRNTSLINQMDGCALSIPCHHTGEAPVGLMAAGLPMADERILRIGLSVEAALAGT